MFTVEFAGGMELLFGGQRSLEISSCQEVAAEATIKDLIFWLKEHKLQDRPELFMQNDTVRPGILVLINDADWELEGGLAYKIVEGDSILFISTLHGG
jgi:ubiquitin related modifier 1